MTGGRGAKRARAARVWQAAAFACTLAASLEAQQAPDYWQIPVPPGSVRNAALEAGHPSVPGTPNQFRAYSVDWSVEDVFRFYARKLNPQPTAPRADTASLGLDASSPAWSELTFYTFADQCADSVVAPAPTQPGAGALPCHKWLYGKDAEDVLRRMRNPYEQADWQAKHWIKEARIVWLRRLDVGVVRIEIVIDDLGLSPDWKRYSPSAGVILKSAPFTASPS